MAGPAPPEGCASPPTQLDAVGNNHQSGDQCRMAIFLGGPFSLVRFACYTMT